MMKMENAGAANKDTLEDSSKIRKDKTLGRQRIKNKHSDIGKKE